MLRGWLTKVKARRTSSAARGTGPPANQAKSLRRFAQPPLPSTMSSSVKGIAETARPLEMPYGSNEAI